MDNKNTRRNLIIVSKLYYLGNLSQDQIAETLGISRPKVSRMLALAREQQIVEFKVKDFPMMAEEMAGKIKDHFGLSEVRIVPSAVNVEHTKLSAGSEAGEYINSVLTDGMQIGVSWGTTLQAMVKQFELKKRVSGLSIIQLAGGVHSGDFNLDTVEVIRSFARKLDATFSILQLPLVVTNSTVRDLLLEEPEIKNHYERFDHVDLALIGLGSILPEEAVPYKAGYITLEQSQQLVDTGFATDICGNRIFLDGSVRPNLLSERLICISPEKIKRIPRVVAIAVGKDKAVSIIAGAKGGFVDVLIIDEIAALTVLSMEGLS